MFNDWAFGPLFKIGLSGLMKGIYLKSYKYMNNMSFD